MVFSVYKVFSGVGSELLSRIVKLHYNWKYIFLCSTIKQIVERYNTKFGHAAAPIAHRRCARRRACRRTRRRACRRACRRARRCPRCGVIGHQFHPTTLRLRHT